MEILLKALLTTEKQEPPFQQQLHSNFSLSGKQRPQEKPLSGEFLREIRFGLMPEMLPFKDFLRQQEMVVVAGDLLKLAFRINDHAQAD